MPTSPLLRVEKHQVTTTTHKTTLVSTANRYTRANAQTSEDEPGVILLLGHGAGFTKEMWEPTIEELFELDDHDTRKTPSSRIREAWALDCQNHGEAAILNGEVLATNPLGLMNIYDYGDAFATLYKSGLLGKINPDLHKVVLVGHSAGCVGVTLATAWFNPPSTLPFSALILVEPPISTKAMAGKENEIYKLVEATTPIRRDVWPSREAAAKWLKSRHPWAAWDERVFDIYVEHGLRPLPTPYYPDKHSGVTLSTHKTGEGMAFTGTRYALDALYRLNQICDYVPVHLIFGAQNDMFDREVQDSIIDPEQGRNFASVTRIEDVGHLIVQEVPRKLAETLFAILRGNPPAPLLSKL